MKSSRSRSRSKNNRNRPGGGGGNVINRVFDSSGPEGKVRGTPQQIIDKYNQLARDAQLSNDRVAAENFQQHAEHYLRLLSEAQREVDSRREEQERQNRERQAERDRDRDRNVRPEPDAAHDQPLPGDPGSGPQPDLVGIPAVESVAVVDAGLVETPEDKPAEAPKPKPKRPRTRKPKPKPTAEEGGAQSEPSTVSDATDGPAPEAAE